MFESRIPAGATEKILCLEFWESLRGPTIWRVMPRNVWNDIVSWQTGRLNNATKYQLHALMTIISKRKKWNPWENCQKCALKLFWNAFFLERIGRPDILWSVNKLARSITKWTKACDERLSRLISHIHHTCDYKQYCHVVNTAKQCRLGLFQDSDFAGDLEDSKSTSGGTLCVLGSHTFVPISWMCKKQTSVSHSSTESEIISLDTGLRLDGIPALDYGIWSSQFLEIRIRVIKNGETCVRTNVFVQHLTQFKNESNLMEWSMIWTILIFFPQTSILLTRKLCCMCLKTTKQWSRWS